LTLDAADDDPVVFWSHAIEALRRVCPGVGVAPSPEVVGAPRIVDIVLPHLVNALAQQDEVVLILDGCGARKELDCDFVGEAKPKVLDRLSAE
jgi:ATP/maltotriose-dependent transcriptional regulator MalT